MAPSVCNARIFICFRERGYTVADDATTRVTQPATTPSHRSISFNGWTFDRGGRERKDREHDMRTCL